jgi:segregation and condensation protein A
MSLSQETATATPATSSNAAQGVTIKLEHFEGPMDLLLYLIQSQEMDISTVSISKVTDQYLGALRVIQEFNNDRFFDIASEYLVMAATLILWKSKSLMPEEQNKSDLTEEIALPMTQDELVRRLQERQRFLEIASQIATNPLLDHDVFVRTNIRPPVEKVWKTMNMTSLATTYQDVLVRERRRSRVIMKKETVSLAGKIQQFGKQLQLHQVTAMKDLINDVEVRGEWVVTFLASLELARLKRVQVYQEDTYQPIFVELIDTMFNFDMDLASGFDDPAAPAKTPISEPSIDKEPTQ